MSLDNYINKIWKAIYNIVKTNFSEYEISTNPLNTTELTKPTILIIYPRTSKIGQKLSYNDEQNKRFRINLYILCDNSNGDGLLAASKIAGELDSWVEHNQYLFSEEKLNMAQITSCEVLDYRYLNNDKITGYNCILEGRTIV